MYDKEERIYFFTNYKAHVTAGENMLLITLAGQRKG